MRIYYGKLGCYLLSALIILLCGCSKEERINPDVTEEETGVERTTYVGERGRKFYMLEKIEVDGVKCIYAETFKGAGMDCNWEAAEK